jgi:Protein of unknown function (DUF664)
MSAETELLLSSLHNQREHVLGILAGLPDEALRRAVLPSGWTCLGLVRHLALDVERFWFQSVMAGERVELESGSGAWQVGPEVPAEDVFALYRREAELADAIITATPLDAAPVNWPDFFGSWRLESMRAVILHVITETATHAGHLDAVRELIDGTTWLIITE